MKTKEELTVIIKQLSKEQVTAKPQRKTVHFKGERKLTSWQALELVEHNRFKLRHLFAAQAILRGKERTPVTKKHFNEDYVKELVKKYTPERVGEEDLV